MSFFSRKPAETTRCVAVITSYAATASVVRHYHGDDVTPHPVVLFSHTVRVRAHHDDGLLLESACGALRSALEACRAWYAASFHRGSFDAHVCTIGEPWVATFSRSVTIEKPKPVTITRAMIDDAIARDRKVFGSEIDRDYPDRAITLVQVSEAVVSVNGYRVHDFTKSLAKSADAQIAYSVTQTAVIDEILGMYRDVFHHQDVTFTSLDVARARQHAEGRAFMVEWGGATVTIAVTQDGIPMHTLSVPMGLHHINDHIAKLFDVAPSRVDAVMTFATDEKLLDHERDEYYRRIQLAYAPVGILIERAADELRRKLGTLPGQVQVIGIPEWISVLDPLVQKSLGAASVQSRHIPQGVLYTHEVAINPLITLVV